jgi:hypothetical protein
MEPTRTTVLPSPPGEAKPDGTASSFGIATALEARWARALLAACGLLAILGAEKALNAAGFQVVFLVAERTARTTTIALSLSAAILGALVPRSMRTHALLLVSVVAYPFFLGSTSAFVAAYAVAVCVLARTPLDVGAQIALALVGWAALPMCRWLLPAHSTDGLSQLLLIVWAGLAYSAIYVLVEHSRLKEKATIAQDLFYLLALPRLLSPFFQPISPSYLFYRERPQLVPLNVARAVALGVYAMVIQIVVMRLTLWWRAPHLPLLEIPAGMVLSYCKLAEGIFLAACLFRLLGFDISSGFRQPFLSRSFAEFFRRFNHYVRDAVLFLFYIPMFARFRRRLPQKAAAIAAAYVGILLGSFVLNQLLVPVASNVDWRSALRANLTPVILLTMFGYWSAIILPSVLLIGRTAKHPDHAHAFGPRALQVMRFLVLYLGAWTAMWMFRNWGRPWW